MQIYQCPNCGRTYTEFENVYYCTHCNYKLIGKEDIKKIKHPELSKRNYHVIGKIEDPTKPKIKCSYCGSTNTTKITNTSKAVNMVIFGIFSLSRNSKQWHCNDCGSDF